MKKLAFIFLLLYPTQVFASSVILDNKAQISRAADLHEAIGALSGKVTDCVEKDKKPIEECGCFSLETCQFKTEYEQVLKLYCAIRTDFPEWQSKTVNYQDERSGYSIALGMIGLEKMFGTQCN